MNKPTPAQCAALKMIGKSAQPTFTATIFSGSDVVGRINSKTLKALRQQGLIEVASAHEERIVPGSLTSYMPAEFRLTEQGKAYLAIRPGEQRERRILFFAAMRQPEMRWVREAFKHLRDDAGIDWRGIKEIQIDPPDGIFTSWRMDTDAFVTLLLDPARYDGIEDFMTIMYHDATNPECKCYWCYDTAMAKRKQAEVSRHE